MVHVKDLFNRREQLRSSEDLAALKREILFVPETRPLDALQKDFQQRRTHMAIVVDEYAGPIGPVTHGDTTEELGAAGRHQADRQPTSGPETAPAILLTGRNVEALTRDGVASQLS